MIGRRSFLGGLASSSLVGSFLVNDPKKLIVPDREIVLATETPPEPLGHVLFDWARVTVRDRNSAAKLHVEIEGYVDELERNAAFFLASERDERLKIYFTGMP